MVCYGPLFEPAGYRPASLRASLSRYSMLQWSGVWVDFMALAPAGGPGNPAKMAGEGRPHFCASRESGFPLLAPLVGWQIVVADRSLWVLDTR
jgi:hypothetical protein